MPRSEEKQYGNHPGKILKFSVFLPKFSGYSLLLIQSNTPTFCNIARLSSCALGGVWGGMFYR